MNEPLTGNKAPILIIYEHSEALAFQANSPSGTMVTIGLPKVPISMDKSP